ncbi:MAG: hypothetical protein GX756_05100 [Clostridiales bacterium]|nr:hypothetical protein [Clostridiales bacterium]
MYGYITPDKSKLYNKDFLLFRAFYCGVCKTTAKYFGNTPRLATNYDIAFLGAFLHAYLNILPQFLNQNCILNPFVKKYIVKSSALLKDITDLNLLLAYHNILDNKIDGGGIKNAVLEGLLKKHYQKSSAALNEADQIIKTQYERLRRLEKENCASLDKTADCFAAMLRDCVLVLVKKHGGDNEDQNLKDFLYNLGKLVYLLDALDDLKEDYKSKNYNPFLAKFGNFQNKEQFIADNKDDIDFIINITINKMIENFNLLPITEGRDLLTNIIYYGLRRKFSLIMSSKKKLRKEKI